MSIKYAHKWHAMLAKQKKEICEEIPNFGECVSSMEERFGLEETFYATMHGIFIDPVLRTPYFDKSGNAFLKVFEKYRGTFDFYTVARQSPFYGFDVEKELESRRLSNERVIYIHDVIVNGKMFLHEGETVQCFLHTGCEKCKVMSQRDKLNVFDNFALKVWARSQRLLEVYRLQVQRD